MKKIVFFLIMCINGLSYAHMGIFLDNFMSDIRRYGVAGVSVAAVSGGDIQYLKGFGVSDYDNSTYMSIDSPVYAGALGKPLTAAAVLRLARDGFVDLHAPAFNYLTIKYPSNKFPAYTVNNLLTHSAGLEEPLFGTLADNSGSLRSLRSFITDNPPKPFVMPGKIFSNGDYSYTLLALLVEEIAGMDYEDYVKTVFLKPMGMDSTSFSQTGSFIPYYERHGYGFEETKQYFTEYAPSSGLVTTAADMSLFLKMLTSANTNDSPGGILGKYRDNFFTPVNIEGLFPLGAVPGFFERMYQKYHYFEIYDKNSILFLFPDKAHGFVFLANSELDTLRRAFIPAYFAYFYPLEAMENEKMAIYSEHSGLYIYAQHPRNDFTKIYSLIKSINISYSDSGNLVLKVTDGVNSEMGKHTEFVQIAQELYKSLDGRYYAYITESDGVKYLQTSADLNLSYYKAGIFDQPFLHKFLFMFFICFFTANLIIDILSVEKRHVRYVLSALCILTLAMFFPATFSYGQPGGIPGFMFGINICMFICFALPCITFIIAARYYKKLFAPIGIVLIFYFLFLYYWRVFPFFLHI